MRDGSVNSRHHQCTHSPDHSQQSQPAHSFSTTKNEIQLKWPRHSHPASHLAMAIHSTFLLLFLFLLFLFSLSFGRIFASWKMSRSDPGIPIKLINKNIGYVCTCVRGACSCAVRWAPNEFLIKIFSFFLHKLSLISFDRFSIFHAYEMFNQLPPSLSLKRNPGFTWAAVNLMLKNMREIKNRSFPHFISSRSSRPSCHSSTSSSSTSSASSFSRWNDDGFSLTHVSHLIYDSITYERDCFFWQWL